MSSEISKYIEDKNNNNEKVLSVFLTAGFPRKNSFTELALNVLDAGADMLEIGFPFSDPIADGPIIQLSSQKALSSGIDLGTTLNYAKEIRKHTNKPIILMGYANPLLSYGIERFADESGTIGVNGLIVPDVPLDEYDNFFTSKFKGTDIILLITPTTPTERIKLIDEKSSGFVYCVSITGITGIRKTVSTDNLLFIKNAYKQCTNNKVLVGFGISSVEDVKYYKPHCDGVIVGSAVIKSLMNDNSEYQKTLDLVRNLKSGLIN
ncbi:MAG: tryptophan synthase subunit alpha [Ignavibacteria bacterium]|nr:tryptophan synthase subunit alpha [Ignavibacteria bacterium]